MTFEVPAEAYDAFMGRYSRHLAAQIADLAGVAAGQEAVDVGCGPGALTTELVRRLGADHVTAVDPSERFVEAIRAAFPALPSSARPPRACRSPTTSSTPRSPSSSSTS